MKVTITLLALIGGMTAMVLGVLTLQPPTVRSVQRGYRGTGQQVEYSPAVIAAAFAANQAPSALPQNNAGPPAGTIYKNVQVLKNVPAGAFARIMVSMVQWVAPKQGCGYCHVAGNFASDAKYQKRVARRMLEMTIFVNADWQTHVKKVGVTCYTCHRGNNVPSRVWFEGVAPPHAGGLLQTNSGEARPSAVADGSALPADPLTPFLLGHEPIRVTGTTALPAGNRLSIQQTQWTYALMMHYATALGVNCDFCHQTRAFADWSESTPQRVTAYYGLHMVRALNNDYLLPLTGTFPKAMLGQAGDVAKVDCATCHQGVFKPLYGAPVASPFPYLRGPAALAQPDPKAAAAHGEDNPAMITMASAPAAGSAKPTASPAPTGAGAPGQ